MAKFCGNCGSPLNGTAVFCGGCGTRVSTDAVASSPAVAPDPGFSSAPVFEPTFTPAAASATTDFAAMPAFSVPAEAATPAAGFSAVPAAYNPPPPVAVTPPQVPPAVSTTGYTTVTGATQNQYAYTPVAAAPVPVAYMPPPAGLPAAGAYPAAKSNTLLKLAIALVLVLFVGGALAVGGVWWAAQKIRAKVHTVAAQVMGDASSSEVSGATASGGDTASGGFTGDPCRFLSKSEVSQAVGMPVLRAEAQDGGCNYIAKGDPADVTARHMSAMLAGMGAGAQAQQMAQKFAGGLFAQQEATDKDLSAEAAKKEIPVLTLVFTAGHAATEMKLNRGGMEHIAATTPSGSSENAESPGGDLAGIGDEAYSAAGSMIMLRKGNVMVRMMYVSCPCNTDNIKPLARMLASRL